MARLTRRRHLGAASGSSSTRWLIGAGVAALAVAGFWYWRSRVTAMDAPSWTPGPLTPMSPDQARQFYKVGLLQHALGIATLKLALLREQNLQNPVTTGTPEAAQRQEALSSAENMVREISASLARVQNGQMLSLAETNDLTAYLAANPA